MKIKEAKKIIGTCIEWNLYMMGITDKPSSKLDPETSLEDLIKANKKVSKWNVKQREKLSGTGKNIPQHQTLADRVIAGIYTALNYAPDGKIKVVINDRAIAVVNIKE
jgi:hypothetical protein